MCLITQERLREVLRYEPETGKFYWLSSRKGVKLNSGLVAGCVADYCGAKYLKIRIDKKLYFAHRLAWLWLHGEWPNPEVDHVNRDGLDNRAANLRQATSRQNKANRIVKNPAGFRGVTPNGNRWVAQCWGYLGSFATAREAAMAFDVAAIEKYGEFAKTNKSLGLL